MNTTQNIQRIIAAGLLAASAGLALGSCAGQRQATEVDTDRRSTQVAEQRLAYRDLAQRRSEMSRDLPSAQIELYPDQAERRIGVGAPVTGDDYRDQAERRLDVAGPALGDEYRDLAERRLGSAGH